VDSHSASEAAQLQQDISYFVLNTSESQLHNIKNNLNIIISTAFNAAINTNKTLTD
jgi:hypothetical protein